MNDHSGNTVKRRIPVYLSQQYNPYVNIAFEHSLLSRHQEACFLWMNDPSVIIGRNQSVYSEIDLSYAGEHDIKIVRRFTGGGAVYHDRGNMNYSLIIPKVEYDQYKEFFLQICRYTGIDAQQSGRNDLLVSGRKFSGTAWLLEDDWMLYHGTCMLNVNREHLEHILTPSQTKLNGKGIKSVQSRVINLCEVYPELNTEDLIHSFELYFQNHCRTAVFSESVYEKARELQKDEWIFGEETTLPIALDVQGLDGIYRVGLTLKDNFICDVQLSSDAICQKITKKDLHSLIGLKYNKRVISNVIRNVLNERD